MQFDVARDAALFLEFGLAADDVHLAALFAHPYGQRSAPVAVAREPPVDDVFQEVAHAPRADGVGHPVDRIVRLDELVFDGSDLDEPALAGVIDEGRIAAPAVRVAVFVEHFFEQQPLLFEQRDDALVRFFDERSREIGNGGLEAAALVHHVHDGQPVLFADAVVVLAEGGRDVHDARAVRQRDVPVADDVVRLLLIAALRVGKERLVFAVFVFAALLYGESLVAPLFEQRGHERLRQNVARAVLRLDLGIVLLRVHAEGDVGGQRPGRRRPGEEVGVLHALSFEAHEHRRLLHVLVSLRDLVRGERRPAARAVGHDLVPLIQQPLLPYDFQGLPDRLDIIVLIGDVRVLHVRPVTHALGHTFPFALVLPHAFLALLDEGLDAVLFDILLAVHAEQFFHFQLDGKPVRIPARLAQDVLALHGLIAGDDILHHAGEDMPDVRLSVRRGRAVVKGKLLVPLVALHALPEHVVLLPEGDDLLLAPDEVHRRVHFGIKALLVLVHSFSPCVIEKTPPVLGKQRAPPKHTYIRPFW